MKGVMVKTGKLTIQDLERDSAELEQKLSSQPKRKARSRIEAAQCIEGNQLAAAALLGHAFDDLRWENHATTAGGGARYVAKLMKSFLEEPTLRR
jgi:hypothetical protein